MNLVLGVGVGLDHGEIAVGWAHHCRLPALGWARVQVLDALQQQLLFFILTELQVAHIDLYESGFKLPENMLIHDARGTQMECIDVTGMIQIWLIILS